MIRAAALLLLASAAIAPLPAAAGVAPAAATAADARFEKALAFVKVLNSPQRMSAQMRDAFFKEMRDFSAGDARGRALEARFPGIFKEIGEAVYPAVEKLVLEHLPELWQEQATLLSSGMTETELDDCIAFFTSPAGFRMVDGLANAFRGENLTSAMDPAKPQMSADAMTRDIQAAAPAAYAALNPADQAALLAFSRTVGGKKLQQLNPEIIELLTRWSNTLLADPSLQAEIARQAQTVVDRRMKLEAK